MKEIQTTITITIKEDGETTGEVKHADSIPLSEPDNGISMAAGYIVHSDDEISEDEAERYAIVSELANVCDYLEDSEVIKIKLIIQKAQARKERSEGAK